MCWQATKCWWHSMRHAVIARAQSAVYISPCRINKLHHTTAQIQSKLCCNLLEAPWNCHASLGCSVHKRGRQVMAPASHKHILSPFRVAQTNAHQASHPTSCACLGICTRLCKCTSCKNAHGHAIAPSKAAPQHSSAACLTGLSTRQAGHAHTGSYTLTCATSTAANRSDIRSRKTYAYDPTTTLDLLIQPPTEPFKTTPTPYGTNGTHRVSANSCCSHSPSHHHPTSGQQPNLLHLQQQPRSRGSTLTAAANSTSSCCSEAPCPPA